MNPIVENFPKYIQVDGKSYLVLNQHQSLDASALYEYQVIVKLARNFLVKSVETCEAINQIQDDLVLKLHFENLHMYAQVGRVRENRGYMQLAKLTAVRIWQEGRQASDEYECIRCGYKGRVNLSQSTLFPCEQCWHKNGEDEEVENG